MHCSVCGGELDAEGWCANYCVNGDTPFNGVGYCPYCGAAVNKPSKSGCGNPGYFHGEAI